MKPKFAIQFERLTTETGFEYLISMLTTKGNNTFWSPYSKEIDHKKASKIVTDFIDELTLQQPYEIIKMNTDYMYNQVERYKNPKVMAYFEGDFSSDSSTVIIRKDNTAYLLLTNGCD